MATQAGQLDTRIQIVTPENIAFEYRVAGPFRRLSAYLIDLAIRIMSMIALAILLSLTLGTLGVAGFGAGLALLAWFVLDWFYGGLFEAFWNGQTPGKRLLQIRVLTTNGQPINGFQAVLRNFLRSVDAMPLTLPGPVPLPLYQVGLVTMMTNDRFQRLGDMAAGTMVVVEQSQRHYGVVQVRETEVTKLAAELPAGFAVSRSLGRALSTYAQRRLTFSWRRREEMARHLGEPLRKRLNLPPATRYDLLLCALYHRTFITDRPDELVGTNPFGLPNAEDLTEATLTPI